MKVAINGAGIAGTALAWWLGRMGHEVLLVERAPALRTGSMLLHPAMELPPGASFDPDPQNSLAVEAAHSATKPEAGST